MDFFMREKIEGSHAVFQIRGSFAPRTSRPQLRIGGRNENNNSKHTLTGGQAMLSACLEEFGVGI